MLKLGRSLPKPPISSIVNLTVAAIGLLFSLANCTAEQPGHFKPSLFSSMNIEFDYPEYWGTLSETQTSSNPIYSNIKGGLIKIQDPARTDDRWSGVNEDGIEFQVQPCDTTRPTITINLLMVSPPEEWSANETQGLYNRIEKFNFTITKEKTIEIENIEHTLIVYSAPFVNYPDELDFRAELYYQNESGGYIFFITGLYEDELEGTFFCGVSKID